MTAKRIVILGGHGKVALLAIPKLIRAGYQVDAIIRNPDHQADVQALVGNPIVLDLEVATEEDLIPVFKGACAIVFTAGAGGKGPAARTRNIDYHAAVCSMNAAVKAGVKRYVMVSYAHALWHYKTLEGNPFYHYAKAKHDADAYLRTTPLGYTILGPGLLTHDQATRTVLVADECGKVGGQTPSEDKARTSRDNVAEVLVHIIQTNRAIRRTINFYEGDTRIEEVFV